MKEKRQKDVSQRDRECVGRSIERQRRHFSATVCVCHNVGAGKLSHRPTDKIVLCRLFAAAASTSSSFSGTCHQAAAAATTPPHLICTFNFDCTLAAAAVCSASLSARRHLFCLCWLVFVFGITTTSTTT